jgi:hypothetical protein
MLPIGLVQEQTPPMTIGVPCAVVGVEADPVELVGAEPVEALLVGGLPDPVLLLDEQAATTTRTAPRQNKCWIIRVFREALTSPPFSVTSRC